MLTSADKTITNLNEIVETLAALIEKHGRALAILHDSTETKYFVNDFVFYCAAKGCKATRAIIALIELKHPEEVFMLTRVVYECYLNAAFAINNPQHIDHLVTKKVGLYTGDYRFQITPNGRLNRRKIENMKNGELMEAGPSIEMLAQGSGYEADVAIHELIYPFLSEHIHIHMMASGNYRNASDQTKYEITGNYNMPGAVGLISYVSFLLLSLISVYAPGDRTTQLLVIGSQLHSSLGLIKYEDEMSELGGLMVKRINAGILKKHQK